MSKGILLSEYKATKSLKSAARQAGISEVKARKMLISEGLLHYERTDKLMELMNNGATIEEAAVQLGISPKLASHYLPYSKGEYNSDTPTTNALKIREYREKKQKEAEG